ncbi:MAG: hypothetical protein KatS3mg111_1318 [Pirellulaceae bacterium]|nr:MAG: hypothetical protein KatS3mg111_1318 [Pirellulaceae bacterium]
MDQPPVREIVLPICHAPEHGQLKTEVVEVEQVAANRYRLLYSPGVVEGVAKGDVIELDDTDPKGFSVVQRSGMLCVWFYFDQPGSNRGRLGNIVRQAVEKLGGICDGGGNTHLIFSIPVSLGFPAIESLLTDLTRRYPGTTWLFGNVYDPWNDDAPLGWWE